MIVRLVSNSRLDGRHSLPIILQINLRPVQLRLHQLLYLWEGPHVHVVPYEFWLMHRLPIFIRSDSPRIAELQDLITLFICQSIALVPRGSQTVPRSHPSRCGRTPNARTTRCKCCSIRRDLIFPPEGRARPRYPVHTPPNNYFPLSGREHPFIRRGYRAMRVWCALLCATGRTGWIESREGKMIRYNTIQYDTTSNSNLG